MFCLVSPRIMKLEFKRYMQSHKAIILSFYFFFFFQYAFVVVVFFPLVRLSSAVTASVKMHIKYVRNIFFHELAWVQDSVLPWQLLMTSNMVQYGQERRNNKQRWKITNSQQCWNGFQRGRRRSDKQLQNEPIFKDQVFSTYYIQEEKSLNCEVLVCHPALSLCECRVVPTHFILYLLTFTQAETYSGLAAGMDEWMVHVILHWEAIPCNFFITLCFIYFFGGGIQIDI